MEFNNLTPLPALAFRAIDQLDQEFYVVVMRCTYALDVADSNAASLGRTHVARLADEQTPLALTDEFHGPLNRSSVRYESDLAPFKPACDVLVNASAWAPGGIPNSRFLAGLQVEAATDASSPILSKTLVVTGPREWVRRPTGWLLSAPIAVQSVPLRYEYAYGGECRVDSNEPAAERVPKRNRRIPLDDARARLLAGHKPEAIGWDYCAHNPVGRGYVEPWWLDATRCDRIAAPQIERAGQQPTELGVPYPVLGMGPIGKGWLPRRSSAGTYDQRWLEERHPYLPSDFTFEYWNTAPADQQVPWLNGDEIVSLYNLIPHTFPGAHTDRVGNTLVRFALPGIEPFVLVRYQAGQMVPCPARLDTLYLDFGMEGAASLVIAVHRAVVPREPPVRLIEGRMFTAEESRLVKSKALEIRKALEARDELAS